MERVPSSTLCPSAVSQEAEGVCVAEREGWWGGRSPRRQGSNANQPTLDTLDSQTSERLPTSPSKQDNQPLLQASQVADYSAVLLQRHDRARGGELPCEATGRPRHRDPLLTSCVHPTGPRCRPRWYAPCSPSQLDSFRSADSPHPCHAERFEWLCEVYKPANRVPAFLTCVDIAGLTKGASTGAGLGNNFLANVRAVDGIFQVVRTSTRSHPSGVTPCPPPPTADL